MTKINPLAEWSLFEQDGSSRLVLRCPDGEQITFDRHAEELNVVLESLAAADPTTRTSSSPLAEEMVRFLNRKGLLTTRSRATWPVAWLDFESNAAPLVDSLEGGPERRIAEVSGGGWLYERTCSALGDQSQRAQDTRVHFLVADWEDEEQFRETNARLVSEGVEFALIHRAGLTLSFGPWVIPGQTACYECSFVRRTSNLLHPDEARAIRRASSLRRTLGECRISDGFVDYLLFRYVMGVLNRIPSVATPGAIQTLHLGTLTWKKHQVLKLPRCPSCGRTRLTPTRSIRDL